MERKLINEIKEIFTFLKNVRYLWIHDQNHWTSSVEVPCYKFRLNWIFVLVV